MTQQQITRELENRFDVIVEWRYPDHMYVEYVSNSMDEDEMEMPDWMYDNISMYDFGYEVCDEQRDRYGYGITIIFCDEIPS